VNRSGQDPHTVLAAVFLAALQAALEAPPTTNSTRSITIVGDVETTTLPIPEVTIIKAGALSRPPKPAIIPDS
jgi:hypothetical protein